MRAASFNRPARCCATADSNLLWMSIGSDMHPILAKIDQKLDVKATWRILAHAGLRVRSHFGSSRCKGGGPFAPQKSRRNSFSNDANQLQ